MSTGVDCGFYEKNPGEWYYDLESYSQREEYDTYGPFPTFAVAERHLRDNHANPGGYWVARHPDSTDTTADDDE